MRYWLMLTIPLLAGGCQTATPRSSAPAGNVLARIEAALPGDYDNHEQVQPMMSVGAASALPIPRLRETLRPLGDGWWLWNLRIDDAAHPVEATWLYHVAIADAHVRLTPYRALQPEPLETLGDPNAHFKFNAGQWAELAACTQTGQWKST